MTCSPSTNFGSRSWYTGLGVNNLLHAPPPFKSAFISQAELPVGWNCVLYQHLPSAWHIARALHPCLGWMNAGQWPPVGRGRRIPSPNWASVATLRKWTGFSQPPAGCTFKNSLWRCRDSLREGPAHEGLTVSCGRQRLRKD